MELRLNWCKIGDIYQYQLFTQENAADTLSVGRTPDTREDSREKQVQTLSKT